MKIVFTAVWLSMAGIANSQDIRFFTENVSGQVVFFAGNPYYCPVSAALELKLVNYDFSEGTQKVFLIPARTDPFKIGSIAIAQSNKKYNYSYSYKTVFGNILLSQYDQSYVYDLSFAKGKTYKLGQGYNGTSSHLNENALDFVMPEGSEILAAREGVVVQVVQNNTASCLTADCKKYNNYINIYHSDGSFANYTHLNTTVQK